MIEYHVEALKCFLSRAPSRRNVLRAAVSAGLALGTVRWHEATEAKQKHKRKNKHKNKTHKKPDLPQVPPITDATRQTVTRTFSSTERIAVPDDTELSARFATSGKANPYPSTIEVSGFTNGVITDVNLTITGLTHTDPQDIDILLSKNDGRQALVMSDAGGGNDVALVDLTLDDEAAEALPRNDTLLTGTFRPMDFDAIPGDFKVADDFAPPAPTLNGSVSLNVFDGADPNGTWQLWVMDNAAQDRGEIGGGWSLEITAEVDVQVQDQIQQTAKGQRNHRGSLVPAPVAANHGRKQP